MKILYLITGRYPTERAYGIQISKTIEALRVLGSEVAIAATSLSWQWMLRAGPIGFWIRTKLFVAKLWFSGKLRAYDALYTRDSLAAFILSFVSSRVLLELHDISSLFMTKRASLRVKGVITISEGLKTKLLEIGIPQDKIIVAPDGVDLKEFEMRVSKEEARKEFDLSQGKKIVLYAGLFDEWKGYKTLDRKSV